MGNCENCGTEFLNTNPEKLKGVPPSTCDTCGKHFCEECVAFMKMEGKTGPEEYKIACGSCLKSTIKKYENDPDPEIKEFIWKLRKLLKENKL